jgi:flagellar hook-basal body complex protein FliE
VSAVLPPIDPVSPLAQLTQVQPLAPASPVAPAASFGQILTNGIDAVNNKAIAADNLVRAFAVDDSIPVHQVTFALTQAQLSLELTMQVRNRLVEGYQQLMNMQL